MNRGEFARELYKQLHVPTNGKTLTFAVAWAAFEDTQARNNPFATTEPFNGATDFNSVGVKNYVNIKDGIDATLFTITNGFYNELVKILRNANSTPEQMIKALDSSPWGSHPSMALYEDVEREYEKYNIEVPGSGATQNAVKENVVKDLYTRNEDGTYTKVVGPVEVPDVAPAETPTKVVTTDGTEVVKTDGTVVAATDTVPAPVAKEDTLEDRLALADAQSRALSVEEAAVAVAPVERRVGDFERRSPLLRRQSATDTRIPAVVQVRDSTAPTVGESEVLNAPPVVHASAFPGTTE